MKIKFIYVLVYLLIAASVYVLGVLIEGSFQNKKIIQLAVFFILAAIADRVIKKFISKGRSMAD